MCAVCTRLFEKLIYAKKAIFIFGWLKYVPFGAEKCIMCIRCLIWIKGKIKMLRNPHKS